MGCKTKWLFLALAATIISGGCGSGRKKTQNSVSEKIVQHKTAKTEAVGMEETKEPDIAAAASKAAKKLKKDVSEATAVIKKETDKTVGKIKSAADKTIAKAEEAAESIKKGAAQTVEAAKKYVQDKSGKNSEEKIGNNTKTLSAGTKKSGKELYGKCAGCHGADGKTLALGKSAAIAGQSKKELIRKIQDYIAGRRNVNGMGTLMKVQVSNLSGDDVVRLSEYISKFK